MTVTFVSAATSAAASLSADSDTETHNTTHVTLTVTVAEDRGDGSAPGERKVPVTLKRIGPADVTGFGSAQVVRTDPTDGAAGVETTLFPSVDLDLPTLPWLIPARASGGQPAPWLCLLVVAAQAGVVLDPATRQLTITTPAQTRQELPDLSEAWAWAHVQHSGPIPTAASGGNRVTADAAATALTDPARSIARLVSPRSLTGHTRYLACVVPTWEGGRLAGLGSNPTNAADATDPTHPDAKRKPAWTWPPPETVTLPVYYAFQFTTGDDGDFTSLVRRLASATTTAAAPPPLKPLTVEWTDDNGNNQHAQLNPPCIFRIPDTPTPPTEQSADPTSWLSQQVQPRTVTQPGMGQLLPPLYGSTQAGITRTLPWTGDPGPDWLQQLATDPRLRVAAGWGAQIVADQRESLTAAAFDQVGSTDTVNRQRSRAQLAQIVAARVADRHLQVEAPLAAAQFLSPQTHRIPLPDGSLATTLAAIDPTLPAKTSLAYRRLTRPSSPHTRSRPLGNTPPLPQDLGQTIADSVEPYPNVTLRVIGDYSILAATTANTQSSLHDKLRELAPPISYHTAMLTQLYQRFPNAVLPGAGSIPTETAVLLADDPTVVAAFMVGLNDSVQQLLRWRSVPTDRRCTPFTGFWNATNDIRPIRDWGARDHLADQLPGHTALAVRSTLFRRYPTTAVYAAPAQGTPPHFNLDPSRIQQPTLITQLPPDIRLFVFNLNVSDLLGDGTPTSGYYLIIQEQHNETRFGSSRLPSPTPTNGASHWALTDLTDKAPPANSATVAATTLEPPALAAIHASRFVTPPRPGTP